MRIVLFDIDATLILTGGAGLIALREVFRRSHGVPDATEGIPFHGLTDPVILQSIAERHIDRRLDAREMDEFIAGYAAALPAALERAEGFRVLPGVKRLLDELTARPDVTIGLATGNFEPTAYLKLRRGGLDGYFEYGGFATDSADRAELTRIAVQRGRERAGPDAAVIVVGDTVHDVRCAREAGADCLAVATGQTGREDLRAAGARWTVDSLEDGLVDRVLGLGKPPEPGPRPA